MRLPKAFFLPLLAAACTSGSTTTAPPPVPLPAPTGLVYELLPSGDPANPVGILLRWDPSPDSRTIVYNVYSRSSSGAAFGLRATTTSPSYYDLGVPDLQYAVTASDAVALESDYSNIVTVDASNQLVAPTGLVPVSLNTAIQLSWLPNARSGSGAALFAYYRVYSTDYDIGTNLCSSSWVLEGTTVSEDFIASGLINGVPRCYAVSAVSLDGHESDWSVPTYDTPRFDARNIVIDAYQVTPATSGFLFYDATTHGYGLVTSGSRTDIDFYLDRHGDGTMWLKPVRTGTGVLALGAIDDLTSIDIAPTSGYGTGEVAALIGNGYAFQMTQADGVHYGGLRVTALGADYAVVDWSYQSDPQNPELRRVGRGSGSRF
jgi:hypothetical protein